MSTYLITGATGYIGSMLLKKLINEKQRLYVFVRDAKKIDSKLNNEIGVFEGDISDETVWNSIPDDIDYVLHCAAPTKSAYMINYPVETVNTIVRGTRNALEFSKRCHCKMLFLSSMEVYGQVDCSDGRRITEDEIGYTDLFSARSCYPMAKLIAEHMCVLYYKEYGVYTIIARLAQIFGRGVLASDNRVFAQFANSVREGKDIVLHTEGKSMGNFCDIDDLLRAVDVLLKRGNPGQAYNVVNEENTMTIGEMAHLVAEKVAGGRIKVVYDIPNNNEYGYAAETQLRLSAGKLHNLGWNAEVSLEKMYYNLLNDLQINSIH